MSGPLTRSLLNGAVASIMREHHLESPVHGVILGPEDGQHQVHQEAFRPVSAGYVRRIVKAEVQRMFKHYS